MRTSTSIVVRNIADVRAELAEFRGRLEAHLAGHHLLPRNTFDAGPYLRVLWYGPAV